MSRVDATAGPDWGHRVGHLAIASLLAGLAAALGLWQSGVFAVEEPAPSRILWASGCVLLYGISCLAQYLLRRSRTRSNVANRFRESTDAGAESLLVAYASQTGHAEQLATRTAESLRSGGVRADVRPLGEVDMATLESPRRVLFILSTTGEGDAPDTAASFVNEVMNSGLDLGNLHYGMLALGDSDYTNFCGFGVAFEAWLRGAGAQLLFDTIQVDNGDAGALRHWQYHLGQLSGCSELPDWQVPDYVNWRLVERRILNPGSVGDPCFHIALQPVDGELPRWQAGDIAEIGPQHAPAEVDAWLRSTGLDGEALVSLNGRQEPLKQVAARSSLKPGTDGGDAQRVAEALARLPHRDYSIASIPEDGRMELLLRQWRRSDGSLGLGTGWLTEYAEPGAEISIRIRANTGFHAPTEDSPLVLIGNGTGIASLRALLRQRAKDKRHRNWLVFGERNSDRDFHYRDEILEWKRQAVIERLDLAFSRDQPDRIYVQHCLERAANEVRAWIAGGATILVCGSLEGMAPGVDSALRRILGDEKVKDLVGSGRYRRDVY